MMNETMNETTRNRTSGRATSAVTIGTLVLLGILSGFPAAAGSPQEEPDASGGDGARTYRQVPDFELTDHLGEPFGRQQLSGKVARDHDHAGRQSQEPAEAVPSRLAVFGDRVVIGSHYCRPLMSMILVSTHPI